MIQKKNIEEFYIELKNHFPRIGNSTFWMEYDWSLEGNDNSQIMSEIAKEVITWKNSDDLENLFGFIENGFSEYDLTTSSFIYTDFLVTITEINDKALRESIKQLMKPVTWEHYQKLLYFYRESGER